MDAAIPEQDEEVFGALYEPDSLYNDTLQQILRGLVSGIVLHHGKLEQVKREDILAGSDINPVTLDQYFKSPDQIMSDVYSELQTIIEKLEKNMKRYRHDAVIRFLMENLRKQPLMLKTLIALNDYQFWENHLKGILLYLTVPYWWDEPDEIWNETFEVFCFEFQQVLKWWAVSDFDNALTEDAFKRVKAWIVSNSGYRSSLNFEWPPQD